MRFGNCHKMSECAAWRHPVATQEVQDRSQTGREEEHRPGNVNKIFQRAGSMGLLTIADEPSLMPAPVSSERAIVEIWEGVQFGSRDMKTSSHVTFTPRFAFRIPSAINVAMLQQRAERQRNTSAVARMKRIAGAEIAAAPD